MPAKAGEASYGFHCVEPPFFGWIAATLRPP